MLNNSELWRLEQSLCFDEPSMLLNKIMSLGSSLLSNTELAISEDINKRHKF